MGTVIFQVCQHYIVRISRFGLRVLTWIVTSPICVFLFFLFIMYLVKWSQRTPVSDLELEEAPFYIYDDHLSLNLTEDETSNMSVNGGERLEYILYERRMSRLRPLQASTDDFLYMVDIYCDKERQSRSGVPLCPCVPTTVCGRLPLPERAPPWDHIVKRYSEVRPGGHWKPRDCEARERTIIIIPQRDRERHLQLLLYHSHAVWQQQQLDYTVYVVEQTAEGPFNKALLMNAAYREVLSRQDFDCVIFHDVDLLLEDGRSLYRCADQPRHLGVYIDKYMYTLTYPELIGGVLALTRQQFESVNGFSNRFYGWGGEDDNLYLRLKKKKYEIDRYPPDVSRYKMVPHPRDEGNPQNRKRIEMFQKLAKNTTEDGFRTSEYRVLTVEEKALYTHILVDVVCTMRGEQRVGRLDSPSALHQVDLLSCKQLCKTDDTCIGISYTAYRCLLHTQQGKLVSTHSSTSIYISKECYGIEQTIYTDN